MATKDEILSWADGVNAYKNSDWDGALDSFQRTGDFSRVHFNMGIIYTRLDDYESASMCYTNAIGADPYLAVAFFQRAYCAYMTEDYQRADGDYAMALELLRENDFIDYSQLGLKYRLYRCEAHYNRAMCAHSIGDDAICTQDVLAAQRVARTTEQKAVIDRAARVGVETVTLFTVPVDAVFEVPESKLKNINERSYLKDAKVVIDSSPGAGGDGQANWAGFDGALILN
ncbi:uncharacterized protein EV422DRAFT_487724, partial [Fimicolochytrium jonesii]|uniref:uncharacterized protein n=1 Tax=Fimicolochytrium jonesii TaxID=1396493 RepID=UPI0022FDD3AC